MEITLRSGIIFFDVPLNRNHKVQEELSIPKLPKKKIESEEAST